MVKGQLNNMKNHRRRLGYFDTLLTLIHDQYNGVSNVGGLTTFQGKLELQHVPQALTILQTRHPNLRAKLIKDKTKSYFEHEFSNKIGDFNFRKMNRIDHNHTISILENEINKPFNVHDSLWQVVLLYGGNSKFAVHDLIIVAHHSIVDGRSAERLANDFMTIISSLALKKPINLPPLPVLKSIEAYVSKGFTWDMFLKREDEIKKNPLVNHTPWKFHNKCESKERKTKIVNRNLSSDIVNRLKYKSRQEKTTVTSTLSAAIASVFIEEKDEYSVEMDMPTPIDLSHWANPPILRENIGNMVSWPSVPLKFNKDTDFWDISRQHHSNLAKSIKLFSKNPFNCDIDYMRENTIKQFYQTEYPLYFSYVTNTGVAELLEKYEPFSLISFSFIPSLQCGCVAAPLTCVTVNGEMHLNFFYPEPLVDSKWHANFVSKVIKTIEDCIK